MFKTSFKSYILSEVLLKFSNDFYCQHTLLFITFTAVCRFAAEPSMILKNFFIYENNKLISSYTLSSCPYSPESVFPLNYSSSVRPSSTPGHNLLLCLIFQIISQYWDIVCF